MGCSRAFAYIHAQIRHTHSICTFTRGHTHTAAGDVIGLAMRSGVGGTLPVPSRPRPARLSLAMPAVDGRGAQRTQAQSSAGTQLPSLRSGKPRIARHTRRRRWPRLRATFPVHAVVATVSWAGQRADVRRECRARPPSRCWCRFCVGLGGPFHLLLPVALFAIVHSVCLVKALCGTAGAHAVR